MEKKIFRSIFAVAFGVLIINTYAIIQILYNYADKSDVLKELDMTSWSFAWSTAKPVILLTIGLIIVATVVASNVARRIVGPINNIDLENVSESDVYHEIAPLIRKIGKQSRQLKRQIKEAEHRQAEFATILENMNEGIIIIDKKYEVLSYNKAVLKLFTDGEAPKTNSVFSFDKSKEFRKLVKKTLSGKRREKTLTVGESSYMIMSNPVYENTRIVGAVIIVMDVTETVERENFRREFTANVSHELKTPLTSISGFAELMKSGIARSEDMPDMAGRIYDEAQRLIVLVNDIIKLSALEDEDIYYDSEDIDIELLINEIKDRLSSAAKKKGVTFIIDKDEDAQMNSIIVNAPRQIISELIYNLCDNAIKYNKDGGSVEVAYRRVKKKLVISVKDTGIGIESEHHDRVFERFYRVDKSHSKEVGGTGLGLSIVKHDVNYLGGQVRIESKLGEGTCVEVVIPMNR